MNARLLTAAASAADLSDMTHRLGCAVLINHRIVTGHNYVVGKTSYHAEQVALENALRLLNRLQAFRHCCKQERFERLLVEEVDADSGPCSHGWNVRRCCTMQRMRHMVCSMSCRSC
jgi:alpha-D-ribose 1-methylphosphonate 5-triphosphate synthase subunit PhnG